MTTQVYVERTLQQRTRRHGQRHSRRWMDMLKPYLEKNSSVYRCPATSTRFPCTWDQTIILSYGINIFNFQTTTPTASGIPS